VRFAHPQRGAGRTISPGAFLIVKNGTMWYNKYEEHEEYEEEKWKNE